jgi:pyruvate dehydrogenase E1 component beta subunit
VADDIEPLALGVGRVAREGSDVTVVAYLNTLREALAAAEALADDDISVEIFDPRSLVPFDYEGLRTSLQKTGRLLIAHEAPQRGGFGAEVAAKVAGECWELLRGPIVRVCGTNTPMPYAPELESFVIPDAARIADGVRSMVGAGVA